MGYQLRKIRERAIAGGYLKVPERKPRAQAPIKVGRTYEEFKLAAQKQREERAAEKRERARQREATQVQRPGAWAKIRGTIGGLFRRKV